MILDSVDCTFLTISELKDYKKYILTNLKEYQKISRQIDKEIKKRLEQKESEN